MNTIGTSAASSNIYVVADKTIQDVVNKAFSAGGGNRLGVGECEKAVQEICKSILGNLQTKKDTKVEAATIKCGIPLDRIMGMVKAVFKEYEITLETAFSKEKDADICTVKIK